MKRKRPSHRLSREKRKKSATGIDEGMDRFFVGGEWRIAGFIHIKPPRWTREYEKLRVRDLVRRIRDDLEELVARAYLTYTEEWQQRFAPNYWRQFPITYEGTLRCVINKSVAEELCHGLRDRITSQNETVSRKATDEYQQLLQQFLESEPRHAANAVAFIGKRVATYLENLFVKRSTLMTEVAAKYDLWPVNLGIRDKNVKGLTRRELQRLEFARNYLVELGLNSQCDFPSGHEGGAEHRISPFKLAAETLYTKMLMLKDDPERHVWFRKLTPWAKRLFALTVPMTKHNSTDWWKVAKTGYFGERLPFNSTTTTSKAWSPVFSGR